MARQAVKSLSPKDLDGHRFWILKSEPGDYSIEDFAKDGQTLWTGVRNYQARNFMIKEMRIGDWFFFYHSNAHPSGIFGVGSVVKVNQEDPTQFDSKSRYFEKRATKDKPVWYCAKVKFHTQLREPISLGQLRVIDGLAEMTLLKKGQRLSVLPIQRKEFEGILKFSGLLKKTS